MDEFTLMRKYAELNRFNAKLKSCPFCGCEASLVFYKMDPTLGTTYAMCTNGDCLAHVGTAKTPEAAVELWNRRINNG